MILDFIQLWPAPQNQINQGPIVQKFPHIFVQTLMLQLFAHYIGKYIFTSDLIVLLR